MNLFLIIDDTHCKKELNLFLKKNAKSIVVKKELNEALKNIKEVINSTASNYIAVNSASKVNVLKVSDIIFCKSSRSYTQLHLANGTTLMSSKPLKNFEVTLSKYPFSRIHQSHLVNLTHIVEFVKGEGGYVLLSDKTKLQVAARKKENLLKELDNL